ncbi:MAG: hypothetical protein J1E35_10715 [Lachnospiraceae bacterium]|nr:hypothetical protein [Lachnospiraceae bacterium]
MKEKRKKVCVNVLLCIIGIAIGIAWLRLCYPMFRYRFDVIFNCKDTHISRYAYEQYTLPLPPSTAFAYRVSDTTAVYFSKYSVERFLEFYSGQGYCVIGDIVYTERGDFILSKPEVSQSGRYYYVAIRLLTE